MRNHRQYRPKVLDLFQSFLAEKITIEELLTTLTAIERNLKNGVISTQKELWFKFFKGDTGATTVREIRSDLYSSVNSNYIKERMQLAIENPKELQIYYS